VWLSTYERSNLVKHSKTVHLGKKDFKCDICDKAFGHKSNLTKHINATHNKTKRFWCDLCDYSSYQRAHLETHSNTVHLGKKMFKCDICDQVFSMKGNIVRHVKIIHKQTQKNTVLNCCLSWKVTQLEPIWPHKRSTKRLIMIMSVEKMTEFY
jgi:uncharacterized Zn-finger protein